MSLIPDSVRLAMSNKSGVNFWENSVTAYKIMKNLTTDITYSISRSGDTVDLDPLWSYYTVEVPNADSFDLRAVVDSLKELNEYIFSVGTNNIFTSYWKPDDTYFYKENDKQSYLRQESLYTNLMHSTNYDCDINMNYAWDIEKGQDFVKVGIIDSRIDYEHPDLKFNGERIVAGGKVYPSGESPFSSYDFDHDHGTGLAGIIGAVSNNSFGISGIAGGDAGSSPPQRGVKLYTFDIILDNSGNFIQDIAEAAILEAASYNPDNNYGFGMDIINISFGTTSTYMGNFKSEMIICRRNECVVVAARGNDEGNNIANNSNSVWPASFPDQYTISVGASGSEGKPLMNLVADPNNKDQLSGNWVNFTKYMDVIAPGTPEIVMTTSLGPPYAKNWNGHCKIQNDNNIFNCASGTSFSTPHVTGVAALLMSHHHPDKYSGYDRLTPTDVEYFIDESAKNLGLHSKYVGSGLLDANNALWMIRYPVCRVYHVNDDYQVLRSESTVQDLLINVENEINSCGFYRTGEFYADRVKVTFKYDMQFDGHLEIIDHWKSTERNRGFSRTNNLIDERNANYIYTVNDDANTTRIIIWAETYFYYIKTNKNNTETFNKWIPYDPSQARVGYSVYICEPETVGSNERLEEEMALYPSPANDYIIVDADLNNNKNVSISIYNIQGKLVYQKNIKNSNKIDEQITIKEFPSSIYICKIEGNGINLTKKFLKK